MPALPKPPGQRVRRNKDQPAYRQLPAEGRKGKAPPLPRKKPAWRKSTRDRWATLWASPMATTYLDADLPALHRLAHLWDETERVGVGEMSPGALSQITALEDRYGLSPKGRRQLQWEIAQGDTAEGAEAKPERRRLRLVADDKVA